VERSVDAEVPPVGVEGERTGCSGADEREAIDETSSAGTGPLADGIDAGPDEALQPGWVERVGRGEVCRSKTAKERRDRGDERPTQLLVDISSPSAAPREAFSGDGDGDDCLVVDGRRGADLEQVAVRRCRRVVRGASFVGAKPGDVVSHAGWLGEVGPRQVGDDATFDGVLAEEVSPTSEEPLLLAAGFDHELRP
jgi:hypothetical protein